MAKKLGISKDVQAKAGIPINAPRKLDKATAQYPNGYEFPIAQLVNVVFNPEKEVKRNEITEKVPALSFVFVTSDKKQFTTVEFPLDEADAKFETKWEAMQQRLKHIFCEVIGENKFKEEDFEGDDFAEFFSSAANAFNAHVVTKDEKEVKLYSVRPVYLKLVYYKSNLQIPMYPNFVQRAENNGQPLPCQLLINVDRDEIEPKAKAKNTGMPDTFGHSSGFPAPGGDFGDFPAVPSI